MEQAIAKNRAYHRAVEILRKARQRVLAEIPLQDHDGPVNVRIAASLKITRAIESLSTGDGRIR